MKICKVIGHAVSTAKHPALEKTKIMVVCGVKDKSDPEVPMQLAIDGVGAGIGSEVLVTESGAAASQVLGMVYLPVRSTIIGIGD